MVLAETRLEAEGLVTGVTPAVGLLSPPLGRAVSTSPVEVETLAGPVHVGGEVLASEAEVRRLSITLGLVLGQGLVKDKLSNQLEVEVEKGETVSSGQVDTVAIHQGQVEQVEKQLLVPLQGLTGCSMIRC